MKHVSILGIPAVIYGEPSEKVYIAVHGKMGCKEDFSSFAAKAEVEGYQTLAFDLPEHGERKNSREYACTVWNSMHDLDSVMTYARQEWPDISITAVSLGAFFSLMAYQEQKLHRCLFVSPILDMVQLIRKLMADDGVTEQELEQKKQIPSASGELLDWEYYRFVCSHPVCTWSVPTYILYGGMDRLTDRTTAEAFSQRFGCHLTIAENSEHWFHTPEQLAVLDRWIISVL
jgi:uncharacterized protein